MKKAALTAFATLILAGSISPLNPVLRDGNPVPQCPPSKPNCNGMVPASSTPADLAS
jgi:hypothetical protein